MYIDIAMLVVWGLVTWCVAGEGAFGAALNCVCIIFAALFAMNFFEPFANFAERNLMTDWSVHWDIIALCGLFAGTLTGLRFLCDYLTPRYPQMIALAEEIGRWGFGLIAGYVTMAFLLTSLHTAPLPREFMGFSPDRKKLLFDVIAPDRQWLGFTQFVSEHAFAVGGQPRIFDGPVSNFIQAPADSKPNSIWPSFPIRYATRRAQFSGAIAPPRPVTAPAPGGAQGRPSTPGAGGF